MVSDDIIPETKQKNPIEASKMYTRKTKISDVISDDVFGEYSQNDPPTFVTVGENDGIANWRVMKRRLDGMSGLGIPTEFHSYLGLRHGFGLGTGTVAEGWIDQAVAFWETQSNK